MEGMQEIFSSLGWEFKEGGGGAYYKICCPFAKWTHDSGTDRDPSLVIRPEKNFWNCYSCGRHGEIVELFQQYNDISGDNVNYEDFQLLVSAFFDEDVVQENIILYPSILDGFSRPNDECLAFMEERGISKNSIKKFNLLYDSCNNNLILPVYNSRGELIGASGRNIRNSFHKHHHFFGFFTALSLGGQQHNLFHKNLIVEGITDLLHCWEWAAELEFNVYCTFTSNLSKWQATQLLYTDNINHIGWDQDKAGRKARKHLYLLRDDFGLTDYAWRPKDLDIGAMTKQQFFSIFS